MARLPDLVGFAQLHGLKIGTIADLIAYRRRTERHVERVLETPFDSAYGGRFRLVIYRNILDRAEHVVLVKGKIDADKPTLVRMHQVDFAADMLGARRGARTTCPRRCAHRRLRGRGRGGVPARSQPHVLSERYRRRASRPRAPACCATTASARRSCSTSACGDDLAELDRPSARPPALDGYGLKIVDRWPIPHEDCRPMSESRQDSAHPDGRGRFYDGISPTSCWRARRGASTAFGAELRGGRRCRAPSRSRRRSR